MADLVVRCPECEARVRAPEGRTAVRCPKCGETIRVRAAEEEDEPRREPPPARRRDEDEEDERPRYEDEDDRPRRRRRDADEDDEDDRPRRRRRPEPQPDGPWLVAVGVSAGCFLMSLGLAFLIGGTAGLPAGQDGTEGKLMGLGIGLIAGLVLAPLGVYGVKQRRAIGK